MGRAVLGRFSEEQVPKSSGLMRRGQEGTKQKAQAESVSTPVTSQLR